MLRFDKSYETRGISDSFAGFVWMTHSIIYLIEMKMPSSKASRANISLPSFETPWIDSSAPTSTSASSRQQYCTSKKYLFVKRKRDRNIFDKKRSIFSNYSYSILVGNELFALKNVFFAETTIIMRCLCHCATTATKTWAALWKMPTTISNCGSMIAASFLATLILILPHYHGMKFIMFSYIYL